MLFPGRLIVSALALMSVAAAPLAAQGASASGVNAATAPVSATADSATTSIPVAPAVSLAPRADAVTAGVRAKPQQPAPSPAPSPAPGRGDTSENRALMIVGGVAFVVGAILLGSDAHTAGIVFMVGGAGVGLYGLFKFLQ